MSHTSLLGYGNGGWWLEVSARILLAEHHAWSSPSELVRNLPKRQNATVTCSQRCFSAVSDAREGPWLPGALHRVTAITPGHRCQRESTKEEEEGHLCVQAQQRWRTGVQHILD